MVKFWTYRSNAWILRYFGQQTNLKHILLIFVVVKFYFRLRFGEALNTNGFFNLRQSLQNTKFTLRLTQADCRNRNHLVVELSIFAIDLPKPTFGGTNGYEKRTSLDHFQFQLFVSCIRCAWDSEIIADQSNRSSRKQNKNKIGYKHFYYWF